MSYYVIGSTSSAIMKVTVTNKQMAAYDAKVSIEYPSHLHPKVDTRCKEVQIGDKKEIECNVINPLNSGKNVHRSLFKFQVIIIFAF